MMRRAALLSVFIGCATPPPAPESVQSPRRGSLVLRDARLPGSTDLVSVRIEDGIIVEIGASISTMIAERDLGGAYLVPQVVDSHVHLAYLPVADKQREAGVVATVDLGAPLATLDDARPRAIGSGPMLTRPAGYPTRGWGRHGYGIEVATASEASAAIDELAAAGARLIKVPLPDAGGLGGAILAAISQRAHDRGLLVVGHALTDADVREAVAGGIDVLAHVPIEPLEPATVRAWAPRPVITTLAAFDAERAAANLRKLRQAGSPVLYGTDLGNTREVGISAGEIRAMTAAGMSGEAIVWAMTGEPASLWGFDVGRPIAPGAPACLLATRLDPHRDPLELTRPIWVSDCPPSETDGLLTEPASRLGKSPSPTDSAR